MKKELYSVYARSADLTFIMEDSYNGKGELISTDCVGWYYGEPTEERTAQYKGHLKAKYDYRI